jgi:hypothetical protein
MGSPLSRRLTCACSRRTFFLPAYRHTAHSVAAAGLLRPSGPRNDFYRPYRRSIYRRTYLASIHFARWYVSVSYRSGWSFMSARMSLYASRCTSFPLTLITHVGATHPFASGR